MFVAQPSTMEKGADQNGCQCDHDDLIWHFMNHHICEDGVVCDTCLERCLREGSEQSLREEVFPRHNITPSVEDKIAGLTMEYCQRLQDYRIATILFFGGQACKSLDTARGMIDGLDEEGCLALAINPLHL